MLIEFYAFYYLIRPHVDLIEKVSPDDSVYRLLWASSYAIHCPACFIYGLSLAILYYQMLTLMFQVLIVPS